MPDPSVIASLTGGPSAFWTFAKKYWLFAVLGVVAILALVVRYRNDAAAKLSGLPSGVKTWLKIAGFALPIGALLLGGDAMAATMCCAASGASSIAGWLASHPVLAAIAGTISTVLSGLAVGMFFQSEDTLDLEDSQNGRVITYTPGATAQNKSLFVNVSRAFDERTKRPLVATAIVVKVVTTVNQPAAGAGVNNIYHDDLNRLVESIAIESPRLGTLLDPTTGQGPVLGMLVSYLGNGFNGSGDAGISTIVPGVASHTVTKYFTFPLATAFLSDPLMTAQFLKALDKTEIKVRIAPTTCLDAVSTGATVTGATSTISGCVNYVPHTHYFRPKMSYFRLDTPASGSDGLTFKNFGDKGPRASMPFDRVTTLAQLSNLKGLPGNTTIDNITRIIAANIGLDDVVNLDLLAQARIKAQRVGASGRPVYADGGNYAMGATAVDGGMGLDKLLALFLLQPSQGMLSDSAKPQPAGSEIKIREEFTVARTGSDAFLIHSVREMNNSDVQGLSALYDGQIRLDGKPVKAGIA